MGHRIETLNPSEREAFAAFMERHSDRVIPAHRTLSLMDTVVSGPQALIDLKEGDLRRAVGLVLDTCESEGNAAELTIVCPERREDWLDAILDRSVEHLKRQGKRDCIDIPQWISNLVPETWLERRGFTHGYSMFKMEANPFTPAAKGRIPSGWRWADCRIEDADALHETLSAAFRSMPGAFVPDRIAFRERCPRYPVPPELLWDGDRVAAFVRVEKRADGSGEIHILGRHPDYRGAGLGEVLMERGIRRLEGMKVNHLHLEVAGKNRDAIALYERFGFRPIYEMKVFRRLIGG